MTELLDRIRTSLVGLRMPRALEALDHTLRRLERAGHAQPDEAGADAVEQLRHDMVPPARRRPTAS